MAQITDLPRNEDGIAAVVGILKQKFGEKLQTGQSIREQHGHTTTWIDNQPPDAVVFPQNTGDVAEVVKAAWIGDRALLVIISMVVAAVASYGAIRRTLRTDPAQAFGGPGT